MDRIMNSFEKARRSNFVPILLLLTSVYLLYFSVKDNTFSGIVICTLFIVSTLYLTLVNFRYNLYLKKMASSVEHDLDFVLDEMKILLHKIDSNNSHIKGNIKGDFVNASQVKSSKNEINRNLERRKKIASVVYSLTLYKKNNIK